VGLSYNGKVIALGASGEGSGPDYSTLVMTEGTAEAVRLGDGDPGGISPDGKWILSVMPSQPSRLVLYPTGTGQARSIDVSPLHVLNDVCSWTSDGSKILFTGADQDGPPRAYLLDAQSGVTRPITPPGTSDAIISPDGQSVIARDSLNKFVVYPVSGGEPGSVGGLAADEVPIQWDISNRKLYVWNRKLPAKIFLLDIRTAARVLWLEITPTQVSGLLYGEVIITPDGKSYGYRYRRVLTDLFLAKGLR
jgi:WD40 repeat protein